MPPWDLDSTLWAKLHMIKVREQRPWRWMLSKGVELFITWYETEHGEIAPLLPASVLPVVEVPASVLPVVEVPAAGLPAAGLPAAGLPAAAPMIKSAAALMVERLRAKVAMHKDRIEGARETLEREPESLQGAAQLAASVRLLPEVEADLVEAQRVLEAELSSFPIDNGANKEEI